MTDESSVGVLPLRARRGACRLLLQHVHLFVCTVPLGVVCVVAVWLTEAVGLGRCVLDCPGFVWNTIIPLQRTSVLVAHQTLASGRGVAIGIAVACRLVSLRCFRDVARHCQLQFASLWIRHHPLRAVVCGVFYRVLCFEI